MSEGAWPKLGASMGIVAAALFIIGFIVGPTGTPPGFNDSAAEVRAFVQENRGEIQTTVAMAFIVLVAFTWFLGSVYMRLRAAEQAARLSVVALAGGLVLIAGAMAGIIAEAAAAYHVDSLDAGTVQALWDLSIFGFLFLWVGFSVLAGASAVLALRAGALPAWLGCLDAAIAVYVLVVGFVGAFSETGAFSPSDGALQFVGFLAFVVWLLVTGIALTREPRPSRRSARPAAPRAATTTPA
jgi:hypothetical protein